MIVSNQKSAAAARHVLHCVMLVTTLDPQNVIWENVDSAQLE
jgi:hypothetical protein